MIEKIIKDRVCPDEILINISDEDKQLIFLEIRREQVREYKLWQANIQSDITRQSPNKKGKNVGFMDENHLVSFLGERPGDKPIEEILEHETLRKAQLEAERQIENEFESVTLSNLNKIYRFKLPKSKLNPPSLPNKPNMKRTPKIKEQKREEMVRRKSTEIYQTYISQNSVLKESAEKENEEITKHWEQVEKQAKFKDEERRKLAKEARKLHAHVNNEVSENFKVINANPEKLPLPTKKSDHLRLVINTIQKTNHSKSQREIKSWFLENEWNKSKIFDGRTDVVPTWFHGMITLEEVEDLLEHREPGTFLIRLSDKFQCYVLSYKTNSRIKHILIEIKPESNAYTFVGHTNARSFVSLEDLIEFFKVKPINSCTSDVLREPCGQRSGEFADYMHLLQPDTSNVKSSSIICSF